MKVLILGGTGDAVKLATKLVNIPKLEIITSLAGRTLKPSALMGNYRIGGFGGEICYPSLCRANFLAWCDRL
jgi:precorrin-6A/cobalt-precorrin-6A reductase